METRPPRSSDSMSWKPIIASAKTRSLELLPGYILMFAFIMELISIRTAESVDASVSPTQYFGLKPYNRSLPEGRYLHRHIIIYFIVTHMHDS